MALTRNYYQRNSSWNAPYTFSSKEKDTETGYGYFGARYYDSGLSIWLSVDPMSDKYPSMSPYNYCANNPIIYIDPDGKDLVLSGIKGSSITIKTDVIDFSLNVSSLGINFGGSYTLEGDAVLIAALDIAGIIDPTGVCDAAAAVIEAKNGNWGSALLSGMGVIPFIGDVEKIAKISKHMKTINKAIDAAKSAKATKKVWKTLSQLQTMCKKGLQPKGISRFDLGKNSKNLPMDECTFSDGSSLYRDGTWRHNKQNHRITNEKNKILRENGWNI